MLQDRFRLLLRLSGENQTEIAQGLDIHSSTVSKILSGAQRRVSRKLARSIAKRYGCDYDWIMSGAGDPPEELKLEVPRPNESGGEGDTVEVEILTLAELGDLYDLRNHAQLDKDLVINVGRRIRTAIRCRGDSMSPTILNDALVGIDLDDREPVDNGIYLLHFRDLGLTIKRLRFRTDGYLVVADNPAIEDELAARDRLEEGFIVGRVRWIYNEV